MCEASTICSILFLTRLPLLTLKMQFFSKNYNAQWYSLRNLYTLPWKNQFLFSPLTKFPKKCTLEFLICNPPNFWTSLTKCHTWYVRYKLVISISTKFPSLFPVSVKASCLSTRRSREELEKKKDLHIGLHLLTHHPLSVNVPW